MSNNLNDLPSFSSIKLENIEKNLDTIITENKSTIETLLTNAHKYTWQNLISPMEEIDDKLHRFWALVSHMHNVVNSPKLREVYNQCIPKLTEYSTEISQNEKLFAAYQAIADSDEFNSLDVAQQKTIEHALRDFKLAGVHLKPQDKRRFAELRQELSKLTTQFENNVMDATDGWTKHITDKKELSGVPEIAIKTAANEAKKRNLEGWVLTLEPPCYTAIITYADSANLREEMYRAYTTRASDQGPNAGKWDNHEVMYKILKTRKKLAKMLGYNNFAEFSLVPKMADNTAEVMSFLEELSDASYPKAVDEFVALNQFVIEHYDQDSLNAWDIAYYSEKLRQKKYDISQEELRPYFPENKVLDGLFAITKRLYGITIKEVNDFDSWHESVRLFSLHDEDNNLRAYCYMDLYARPNKRGGAWMDDCRSRFVVNGEVQIPIAFLNCNFNAPVDSTPCLLNHYEVETVFHEFGHCLHHMLTTVDYSDVSGINGVPWDAVELPSQFFEYWTWDKEAIELISEHFETKEKLPDELYNKMLAAKNFQSALAMVRQLEFSLFDFRLHMEFDEDEPHLLHKILEEVREDVCVIPIPEFNRFPNSFTHIFSGGYSAGYYSYKWAEVLAADAFSKFEETGVFNEQTGREFLHNILEKGGSEEPKKLFVDFRGREPTIDALLRQNGIRS